ncbi:MAG: hypothetical protein JXO72_16585 [Vicinamibacteria bacterium]|nr:hypothetical protein [Vicinamibacteria bacterium]
MSEETPEKGKKTTSSGGAMEVVEEARVGGSQAGRTANLALLALSRAARSFLLYDPSNDAIRRFIEDLRLKFTQAVEALGCLDLEVRPFELALAGEIVYLERDRERSLAFRMYRDGVRRLTFREGVEWDEILRLLEVLSVRYTGVRQNEDDIVTLLWKAGFEHVDVDAVEGFVPDEEEEREGEGTRSIDRSAAGVHVPADWDLPARRLDERAAVAWKDVGESERERLRDEEASHNLPANAERAARELLRVITDSGDPTRAEDVWSFVFEVRDFLLSENQIGHLTALVRAIREFFPSGNERAAEIVASFADKRALAKIMHSTPKTTMAPPPELIELLDLLPQQRIERLIDVLGEERSEASRRLTRQLLERYAPEQPDYVIARMREAEAGVACDLLRALARALPEKALDAAIHLADHPDLAVAHEAMLRFEKAPHDARISRVLARLAASPHQEARWRALELIGARKEHGAFGPIVKLAEERQFDVTSMEEAARVGRTLATLSSRGSTALFRQWLRPKGLVGRLVETAAHRFLEWSAISGLEQLPGEEPEELIRQAAEKMHGDMRAHCLGALVRRRHRG